MRATAEAADRAWGEDGAPISTFARNVGTRYVGIGVEAILGLLILPFNVGHLGKAAYGLWMLAASVTAYFSVLDLGYAGALVRFVAKYRARRADTMRPPWPPAAVHWAPFPKRITLTVSNTMLRSKNTDMCLM